MKLLDMCKLRTTLNAMRDDPDEMAYSFQNNAGYNSTEWDCIDDVLDNLEAKEAISVPDGNDSDALTLVTEAAFRYKAIATELADKVQEAVTAFSLIGEELSQDCPFNMEVSCDKCPMDPLRDCRGWKLQEQAMKAIRRLQE